MAYLRLFENLATRAVTLNEKGSQFVVQLEQTLSNLKEEDTSILDFLVKLSGQISGQMRGDRRSTQTPQTDIFPHLNTMVWNSKRYIA